MTRAYLVVFEKGNECWGAFAPDIPGTGGMGDTIEETRKSLREGIGYMLDDYFERGAPFPSAETTTVNFSEFDPNPAESHYEIEWLTVDLPTALNSTEQRIQQAA